MPWRRSMTEPEAPLPVLVSVDGPIGRIVLNRPDARNAIDWDMVEGISIALRSLALEQEVRVVELTARGPAFCAGGDLSLIEGLSRDGLDLEQMPERWRALPASLYECPLPIVAGVADPAVGAGCDLVLACDLVIATPDAYF